VVLLRHDAGPWPGRSRILLVLLGPPGWRLGLASANPISSDARRLRSAGRLFYRQGRLLRPVQDCSLDYGLAVRLMQVEKLSPDEYAETEIEVIDTSWHPKAIRTHTLTRRAGWRPSMAAAGCRRIEPARPRGSGVPAGMPLRLRPLPQIHPAASTKLSPRFRASKLVFIDGLPAGKQVSQSRCNLRKPQGAGITSIPACESTAPLVACGMPRSPGPPSGSPV